MKMATLGKAFLCMAVCVATLASCGESEQPAIDSLTPAAAPLGQNLLDDPNPNLYDQWVGRWDEVYYIDDTRQTLTRVRDESGALVRNEMNQIRNNLREELDPPDWEYLFDPNGTFKKIAKPHHNAPEHMTEQSGFYAVGNTEFYMGYRNPSSLYTPPVKPWEREHSKDLEKDVEGTWWRSQDYLILRVPRSHAGFGQNYHAPYFWILRKVR